MDNLSNDAVLCVAYNSGAYKVNESYHFLAIDVYTALKNAHDC